MSTHMWTHVQAHMWTKGGFDVYRDRMLLASHGRKLIKPEIRTKSTAPFLSLSMQSQRSSKYKVCSMKKPSVWGSKLHFERQTHHGLQVLARRALLLQFLAIFETVIFKSPLLVNGLARADEISSYPLDGPGGAPTEEVALQGLPFTERLVTTGGAPTEEVVLQGLPFTARLVRPNTSSVPPSEQDDELEEILSVKLKLLRRKASAFLVFVNLPDANGQTPITCIEFAGSYIHEPRRVKSPEFELQETVFRIGIGDVIKELGLVEQPSILVTFVPCGADKELPVVLKSLYVELE